MWCFSPHWFDLLQTQLGPRFGDNDNKRLHKEEDLLKREPRTFASAATGARGCATASSVMTDAVRVFLFYSVSGRMSQNKLFTADALAFVWPLGSYCDSRGCCEWCVCTFRTTGMLGTCYDWQVCVFSCARTQRMCQCVGTDGMTW